MSKILSPGTNIAQDTSTLSLLVQPHRSVTDTDHPSVQTLTLSPSGGHQGQGYLGYRFEGWRARVCGRIRLQQVAHEDFYDRGVRCWEGAGRLKVDCVRRGATALVYLTHRHTHTHTLSLSLSLSLSRSISLSQHLYLPLSISFPPLSASPLSRPSFALPSPSSLGLCTILLV